MRQSAIWGLATGLIVAVVAWFRDSTESAVSLFPDLISLIVFAVIANLAFSKTLRAVATWRDALRSIAAFGIAAGVVLAIVTLLRGFAWWSSPQLPLMAATLAGSLFVVVLLSCSIGILAFHTRMRRARVAG